MQFKLAVAWDSAVLPHTLHSPSDISQYQVTKVYNEWEAAKLATLAEIIAFLSLVRSLNLSKNLLEENISALLVDAVLWVWITRRFVSTSAL